MERLPVDDLGTGAEHMGTLYLWRPNKRGQRVHILDFETGRTFCQVENCGGKSFDGRGAETPPARRLCGNCVDLTGRNNTNYQEPSLAVLLGERLAETEPELFYEGRGKRDTCVRFGHVSTVVPKPSKRGKQARPARRSKGGKPKRSKTKYPLPFNDALPW